MCWTTAWCFWKVNGTARGNYKAGAGMDGMFLQTGRIFEPIRYPDGEILAFLERQPERIRAKDLESVKADDTARVQKPRGRKAVPKTSFPAGAATSGAGGTALTWGQCSGKGTVIGCPY